MEMGRLTRDGTAEPVSRDQIRRRERGQGNIHFPCSADHEQDWQPYPDDPYSAMCDDHTYIHTYILLTQAPNLVWLDGTIIVYYYYHTLLLQCLLFGGSAWRLIEVPVAPVAQRYLVTL